MARGARIAAIFAAVTALLALPGRALAHATEQSFVLLLPTDYYIAGGVAAVALTVVLIALVPERMARAIFAPVTLGGLRLLPGRPRVGHAASLLSALLLGLVVAAGALGTRDPTHNALPVFVWTVFWVGIVVAQGLFGNIWAWANPWTGPAAAARALGLGPVARLPVAAGHWIALVSFFAFAVFLLVDTAPADPGRLAVIVAGYWALHMAGALVFGPRWLPRAEAFTAILSAYALMSVPGREGGRLRAGIPGWRAMRRPSPPLSVAVLMVALLAVGSFDGLYETFFWFSLTGQNPLEFAGRSAVVGASLAGLCAALPALVAAYGAAVAAGHRLAGGEGGARHAFRAFAPALLPIALAYHIAHYLPSFLVDAQAVPIVMNDPLGSGADLFGWGHLNVTTGFFNRLDSVRLIWLTQAGAVVAGHVIAILLGHALALRLYGSARRAALSQAPLAAFMVAYTLFGLWLLASPRGV